MNLKDSFKQPHELSSDLQFALAIWWLFVCLAMVSFVIRNCITFFADHVKHKIKSWGDDLRIYVYWTIAHVKFTIKIRGINGMRDISLWSYTNKSYNVYFRRHSTGKTRKKSYWNFFLPTWKHHETLIFEKVSQKWRFKKQESPWTSWFVPLPNR